MSIDVLKMCGGESVTTFAVTAQPATFVPSESLATVAEADAYHAARGAGLAWSALSVERKEQLLRQGYDYLLALYGTAWPSELAFGVDAEGLVPTRMRDANSILALKAQAGPLMPEPEAQTIEETVGPLTTKYATLAPTASGLRIFPDVARLVLPCLPPAAATGAFMSPIVRN